MKYAILGEDTSDAATIEVLIRRLIATHPSRRTKSPSFRTKGYGGYSHLCRKAARDLKALQALGYQRFVICVDADGPDPRAKRNMVEKVIKEAGVPRGHCLVLVPVQELEAWILADIEAVSNIIISWKPKPITNPEGIRDPKERLRRISRDPVTKKTRYHETWHNERVAKHLSLDRVVAKCKSFKPLVEFFSSS